MMPLGTHCAATKRFDIAVNLLKRLLQDNQKFRHVKQKWCNSQADAGSGPVRAYLRLASGGSRTGLVAHTRPVMFVL